MGRHVFVWLKVIEPMSLERLKKFEPPATLRLVGHPHVKPRMAKPGVVFTVSNGQGSDG